MLAWNYGALLACRLLTGVGAAMIPPNSMAAIADHFTPAQRGRPISLLVSASFLGAVCGIPVVALLGELGGWRLPFGVIGGLCVALWGCQWLWWPRQALLAGQPVAFWSRFPPVSRRAGFWHVLGANALYQTAAFGLCTSLAAFLSHPYGCGWGTLPSPWRWHFSGRCRGVCSAVSLQGGLGALRGSR
jgi:predicted MFS family arabinose efflux permease